MSRRLGGLLLVGLVSLLVSCAPPAATRPDRLTFPPLTFQVPAVERVLLPGGIRLYLKEDHELPLVRITALVGAGDIGDPADKTGQGGLFAALLRTGGAGDRSPEALDDEIERLAADLTVATDTYATTCDLSLRSADLQTALGLLADLLRRPRFDAGRLELARRQAVEGIRRQDDKPGAIAQRTLRRAVYGDHPFGRTATVETVGAITRDDLLEFQRRFITPDNLWLAISGDFDRAQLLDGLNRVFGDWTAGPAPRQELPPVGMAPPSAVWVADKNIPQTTVLLGEVGIAKDAPDLEATRVMNYILGGGGFNSRLMREIRSNRGLAYSVYSYFQVGRRLPGPFIAGTETKSSSTLAVVKLLQEEMERMRRDPVTVAELHLAQESLINSFVFAFTDSHEVVSQQLRLDFYGYPSDYLQGYRDRVASVTTAEVLQAARDHLHPERQAVVLVGRVSDFDEAPADLGLPVETVAPIAH